MLERALKAGLRGISAFAWDRPLSTAALLAVALVVAIWGATRLQVDLSSASFYADDDDAVRELARFHERWGPDDDILMVIAQVTHGDLLTRARVEAIGRLADTLAAMPGVRAVTSMATQRVAPPGKNLDDAVPLWELPAFDPDGPLTRDRVLADMPFVPLLLSTDAGSAAIVVELTRSSDDPTRVKPVVDGIEQIVAAHDGELDMRFAVAGVPAVRVSFVNLTEYDQRRLVPLSLLVMGAALFWIFRRPHGVAIPALAAVVPLVLLLGLMGWTGEPIGLLNQSYFTLIPVLALADAVHLLARCHEERARHAPRDAVLLAVEHVGLACTLTTATTVIGFSSLALGGSPMLTRFGVYAAAGMAIAYGTVFLIVPSCLRFVPGTPARQESHRLLRSLAAISVRHAFTIVVCAVGIGVVMTFVARRVTVDNRLSDLLKPDHPVRQAGRVLDASLGGTLSLEIELNGPDEGFLRPSVLNTAATFEDWVTDQPGVRTVIGPGRSVETVAASAGILPVTPDAVRSAYERLATFVDPSTVVRDDYADARISVRVAETGGLAFEKLTNAIMAEARAVFEPLGIDVIATGTTLVAYRGVNHLGRTLAVSLASLFVVIAAMFLVLFRSPRVMLLALLPNVLPLIIGYGMLGARGANLDPLSGVILAFGLGVAVDNTIHVLARTREAARQGLDAAAAVTDAIAHSGRAVAITALVISAGLAINILSSFPPLELLGVLGAVLMLSALACNLLLLPASLILFRALAALGR